jgi:hypothetical protein
LGRKLCVIAAAALAVGLVAPAVSSAASVRILSPKEDAHLRSTQLRVKVRARGPDFRAFLDGRKVTSRFKRRGSVRTAVLSRGRHFGLRDHVLTVRVGPRFRSVADTVTFIAMGRADHKMDVRYDTSPKGMGSRLLRVKTDRRLWNTTRMPRVLLNGRRVDDALELTRHDRGIRGGLGADEGLRHGRNHLVVEMLQRDGSLSRDVHSFVVPRDRPLAGAGPHRTIGVGEPVRLDGSATRPSPGAKSGISYRWRIIRAPKRSQAKLRNADGVRPLIRPRVPGRYVIRLIATPAGGGAPSMDEVTVNAPQTDSPMGMPIQTISRNGAVVVGKHSYGSDRAGVMMVVLDASGLNPSSGPWGAAIQTFAPTSKGSWSNGEKTGCRVLVTCVNNVNNKDTVILSGQGRAISNRGLTGTQVGNLRKAINGIGGTVSGGGQTPNGAADLLHGDWSVIGSPILGVGQANQNYFLTQAPINPKLVPGFPSFPEDSGSPGSLNGFMQHINENVYQYISPEYFAVDTKWTPAPDDVPSSTQNTIQVGDAKYESDSIPNGAIGFQVLVLSESSPLRELDHRTFVVLNPNCTTNQDGVKGLAQNLGDWVHTRLGPTTAGSYLMVVQDFGRQSGECWPGKDSPNWVHDALPPSACSDQSDRGCNTLQFPFGWNGQRFPNSTSDLFSSWDRLVPGGSVAGSLGKLAGVPVHDIVANYRRPYYDDKTHAKVNRTFGGLTVVASTHAYQWSSAFSQGQGDDASVSKPQLPQISNGRVTGILRRNEQSQWQLDAGARGAGWKAVQDSGGAIDQAAFFDLLFQEPTTWPCTVRNPAPCPNLPSEIRAAHRWFVSQISPKSGVATIRDLYPKGFPDTTFDVSSIQRPYPNPGRGPGYFSPQVFQAMKFGSGSWPGLVGEVGDVNQVVNGIHSWQNFFREVAGVNAKVDVSKVGQTVITNLRQVYSKLEQQSAEVDGSGILDDLMLFATELADVALAASGQEEAVPVLSAAMGAMSSGLVAGDTTANALAGDGPSSGQSNVPNAPDAINDKVGQLSNDMNKRYQTIALSLGHFGAIFVDDWGKLQEAAANFDPGGPWQLTTDTVNSLGQSIAGEAETAMYETALPITYSQWMISPRKTNRNPQGPGEIPAATGYSCPDEMRGNVRPWASTSSWSLTEIGWSGGGAAADFNSANSAGHTVRGLKSVADEIQPDTYQYYDDTYFGDVTEGSAFKSGTSADEALIRPLFDTITPAAGPVDPGPLGASKEEVFGLQNWNIKMLQCGGPPYNTPQGIVDK